jgi:hypothetical protein
MRLGKAILGALCALLIAGPATAQSPDEIVRWIYTSIAGPGSAESKSLDLLMSPAQRGNYFSRRLVTFFDTNDTHGNDLSTACLDFGPHIPGQDFDAAEIGRTVNVSGQDIGGKRQVTAAFLTFGQPAQVTYEFIVEDGFWRIDDIIGEYGRLSAIPCQPRRAVAASAPQAASGGFCYQRASDTMRLDLAPDGSATFRVESWQGGGHSCFASGFARAIEGGWLHEDASGGRPCQLSILVTPDQGLRLSDPNWQCKMSMCGQRATLDGLEFPRSAQVDCAAMPRN